MGNDEFMIGMTQKLGRFRDELEEGKAMFTDEKMKKRLWKILNQIRTIATKL